MLWSKDDGWAGREECAHWVTCQETDPASQASREKNKSYDKRTSQEGVSRLFHGDASGNHMSRLSMSSMK